MKTDVNVNDDDELSLIIDDDVTILGGPSLPMTDATPTIEPGSSLCCAESGRVYKIDRIVDGMVHYRTFDRDENRKLRRIGEGATPLADVRRLIRAGLLW